MAIQIAKMLGATVIATTTQADKADRARSLGADRVVVSTEEDFVGVCKALTGKRGVDVVIEHIGGEVFRKSILATAWGGRVVTCGATAGFHPEVDLRQIFFRQIQVLGSTMGPQERPLRGASEHVEAGALRPVVDRVMPLWEAREAHRSARRAKSAFGKIVLSRRLTPRIRHSRTYAHGPKRARGSACRKTRPFFGDRPGFCYEP
jgi:NADPH:quinone reductase-like Zn-dependent oxidoreductase